MGRESRDNDAQRLSVLRSVLGHENTVAHSFNHTNGQCPMCACPNQHMMFCDPGSADSPKVRGCELDGAHLHRVCAQCSYPWIERTLDQAMHAEQRGEVVAESELAAALACILQFGGQLDLPNERVAQHRGWVIQFTRQEENLRLSVSPPAPQVGVPVHPDPPQGGE